VCLYANATSFYVRDLSEHLRILSEHPQGVLEPIPMDTEGLYTVSVSALSLWDLPHICCCSGCFNFCFHLTFVSSLDYKFLKIRDYVYVTLIP
jgi:hypothetical protein